MKNSLKRIGLLSLGIILCAAISFAADFKEVKKDIKHSIENIQLMPSASVEFNQANVLIHNSGDLKISANEVGELKFGEVNAIENKKLRMRQSNYDFVIEYRQHLKANGYYTVIIPLARRAEYSRRSYPS